MQERNIYVASFTDAWIETLEIPRRHKQTIVASFTDAWIETRINTLTGERDKVASFTDAWIETISARKIGANVRSHLLQMRGLKRR